MLYAYKNVHANAKRADWALKQGTSESLVSICYTE